MNLNFRAALMLAVLSVFILSVPRVACAEPPSDPCSLLTQAQVSTVLGVSVGPAKRLAPTICVWSSDQPNSGSAKKVLLHMSVANAFPYAKTPVDSSEKAVPASGVCDDAVYSFPTGTKSGPATTLYVKKGSSYFVIHLNGFPDQTKTMAVEKTLALDACSKL